MIIQAAAKPSIFNKIGGVAQSALNGFATAKGLYDIGTTALGAARAAAPYVRAAMTFL
mgnify:CR=1 FL=1|tara:strand:+ start:867 stop:1040 length:174 start_codon:yes stop_codon:yes gene_type:complete